MKLTLLSPHYAAAALGACLAHFIFISAASADVAIVAPERLQTFRGWGMSLAWEANKLYGTTLTPSQVPDPQEQANYLDMLFGEPHAGSPKLTLGLNMARYNIGGGENPDPHHFNNSEQFHMRPDAQMEGFLDGYGLDYNWSRDASQRKMLHEAKSRGVNIFEAFSNSPPYWMTISGCASGAVNRGQDNLDPKYYDAFADYLVTVMKHLQEAEGIIFESLEPFNEPDGWWWVAGGGQEGNYAKAATQDTVLQLVQRRLQSGNHVTFVAGPDANNYDLMPQFLDRYSTDTIQALGRVNVHQYLGTRPLDLRNRIAQLQKPLWMSEVGCCFPGQTDGTEMDGAMWMARQIRVALRDMRAEAWILWQPDWNIIDFNSGHPKPMRQYFAIAQYSNFIRPGYQIISSGADNTLAAYSRADRRLVLVATNSIVSALGATGLIALQPSAVGLVNDYDLSAFVLSKQTVRVYRTTVGASMRPIAAVSKVDSLGRFTDFAPPQSITTYVFDGVDLTSSAPRNER